MSDERFIDVPCGDGITRYALALRPKRPRHQPAAPEAPIPGRHWYAGCDPDGPVVGTDGRCEGCGAEACPECGHEVWPDGVCACVVKARRGAAVAFQAEYSDKAQSACPTCRGTGGGQYNDCPTCDGNGIV